MRWGFFLLVLLAARAFGQSYEEKVVAAVLMGEAWNQGEKGMLAVAEVISQRVRLMERTPLQVVTMRKQFSCLNGTTPSKLYNRFARYADFDTALRIAQRVCQQPETLTRMTNRATNFTRKEEKPYWARGRKPVAVIGDHAFYRLNLQSR